MSEHNPEKREVKNFLRSAEELSRYDVSEFAHDILARHGELHQSDTDMEPVDYTWEDTATGDRFLLSANSLGPEAYYMLEVNDGRMIDSRARYTFSAKQPNIGVETSEGAAASDEPQYMQTRIMQWLDTTGVERPRMDYEGQQMFWGIAARQALEATLPRNFYTQLTQMNETGSLGRTQLLRNEFVRNATLQPEYRYVPSYAVHLGLIALMSEYSIAERQSQTAEPFDVPDDPSL